MVAMADWSHLPTEDTKYKVEHEEGTDDNERHEVNPVEETPQGIVSLKQQENVGKLPCFCFMLFALVGSAEIWRDSEKYLLKMLSRPMDVNTPVTAFCGEGSKWKFAMLVSLSSLSAECRANWTIIHYQVYHYLSGLGK